MLVYEIEALKEFSKATFGTLLTEERTKELVQQIRQTTIGFMLIFTEEECREESIIVTTTNAMKLTHPGLQPITTVSFYYRKGKVIAKKYGLKDVSGEYDGRGWGESLGCGSYIFIKASTFKEIQTTQSKVKAKRAELAKRKKELKDYNINHKDHILELAKKAQKKAWKPT